MNEPTIAVSAKRVMECHAALLAGDAEEAYNALYWAIQDMPEADPFKPFEHVEKLVGKGPRKSGEEK